MIRLAPALALLSALCLPASAQFSAPPSTGNAFKDTSSLKPPAGAKIAIIKFEDLECPACAHAINQTNELLMPMFLEPLPVRKNEKGYEVVRTAAALVRLAGVASALGDSSRLLWLKLPYCEDFARVAKASSFPILLLGGESTGQPSGTIEDFVRGMGQRQPKHL